MKLLLPRSLVVLKVIGQSLCLYGFLGWIYGVAIQLTHPSWLPQEISHLTLWLRLDTFTIVSFLSSGAGFFIWMIIREYADSEQKSQP